MNFMMNIVNLKTTDKEESKFEVGNKRKIEAIMSDV